MKAIANMQELVHIPGAEREKWQQKVYKETHVIPIFQENPGDITLFSNCGYIDLDMDAEYHLSKGLDLTEYCVINKVEDLIQYIQEMESYKEYLIDYSLGQFMKSDLFWGIWNAIITAPKNIRKPDGTLKEEWSLHSMTFYHDHLTLQMVLIDYDMVDIWIDITHETSLEEALSIVVKEMNKVTEELDDIPEYDVYTERIQNNPNNFEALYACISPTGVFSWLN